MSANLDLVRSIYADWERGDFSATRWAHPEIELLIADGPEPGRHKGLAAMAEHWRGFLGAWEGYRVRADEYRELDGGQVLVLLSATGGRGKSSGVELGRTDEEGANLFQIGDGKVTRLVVYFDSEHAHADLGLAPEHSPAASSAFLDAFRAAHEQAVAASNRGDWEQVFAGVAPDFEFHSDPDHPEARVMRSPEEWRGYVDDARASFPDWHFDPVEYIDAGHGTVIVRGRLGGTGRFSGLAISRDVYYVWETKDGVAIRCREFLNRERAFASVGLEG